MTSISEPLPRFHSGEAPSCKLVYAVSRELFDMQPWFAHNISEEYDSVGLTTKGYRLRMLRIRSADCSLLNRYTSPGCGEE